MAAYQSFILFTGALPTSVKNLSLDGLRSVLDHAVDNFESYKRAIIGGYRILTGRRHSGPSHDVLSLRTFCTGS